MTTEAYTGASSYTISGTGPYNIGHEYSDEADIACIVLDDVAGTRVVLDAADFTVSPDGPADDGDVTLTSDAATTHDGLLLVINRETTLENGWEAVQGPREDGLEAQLDRLTRAAQDASRTVLTSLRADIAMNPIVPVEGAVVGFDENLQPISIVNLVETAASAYMATLLLSADRAAFVGALGGNLDVFDGLAGEADKGLHFTGPAALALHDVTAAARTFLAAVDATAQRTALGLGGAATRSVSADPDFEVSVSSLADRGAIADWVEAFFEAQFEISGNLVVPSSGNTTTYSHSLGVVPSQVSAELICVTAEYGYAVGDVIELSASSISTTANASWVIYKNDTEVGLVAESSQGIWIANKSDNTIANLSEANWALRFRVAL